MHAAGSPGFVPHPPFAFCLFYLGFPTLETHIGLICWLFAPLTFTLYLLLWDMRRTPTGPTVVSPCKKKRTSPVNHHRILYYGWLFASAGGRKSLSWIWHQRLGKNSLGVECPAGGAKRTTVTWLILPLWQFEHSYGQWMKMVSCIGDLLIDNGDVQ